MLLKRINRVKGSLAGTRYPNYLNAQREATDHSGNRWDYFVEPLLNLGRVPTDDLDFVNTQYPYTDDDR